MTGKTLYVSMVGAVLSREGQRFVIRDKEHAVVQEVPCFELTQVVLIGNVQITGAALDLILQNGIDTVFVTQHGKFKGRIDAWDNHWASLRLKQYQDVLDPDRRLTMARSFIEGKLRNMRTLLQRRQREGNEDVATSVARLELAVESLASATTPDQVRGIEGSGSAAYFAGFKACLRQDLGFDGRRRRPPPDPVNALLSFGYTLLTNYVGSALATAGLDPFLGYLHEIADRKPALTLDAVEEFRPLIVDTVVLATINRMELTVKDFEKSGEGFHMKPPSLARFVKALEARLDEATGAIRAEATTLRLAIEAQARQLVRVLTGKQKAYTPIVWR